MANTTTEKETQSQIKLTIILHSRSSSMPRKELVLYVPRSQNQKREPSQHSSSDTPCNKRCKVMASSDDTEYSSVTKSETNGVINEQDSRNLREDVSNKMRKVTHDHEISAYPTKSGGSADNKCGVVKEKWRVSKTGCENKEKKKTLTKRVVTKDSRFVDVKKCERKGVNNSDIKKMKMRNVASTHKVNAINTDQYPTKPSIVKEKGKVGLRISRSGNEDEC
ncbi:hypothetical protein Lal_00037888 [Lupinus albus]|nr:hypothetical protein Lal_00037888 [Lupinus albus]